MMIDSLRNEPVRLVAAVAATIALARAFGLDLTDDQTSAVLAALSAWLWFVTREQVTPV